MTTGGVVQPERKPSSVEGRAQLLAFKAYLARTKEQRRKLAKSAVALSSEYSDVLLLEVETDRIRQKYPKYTRRRFEMQVVHSSQVYLIVVEWWRINSTTDDLLTKGE